MAVTDEFSPWEHPQELDVVAAVAEVDEAGDSLLVLPHPHLMGGRVVSGRELSHEALLLGADPRPTRSN